MRKTFIFNEKGELVEIIDKVELTCFREETVLEKDRFGVESGELILSTEGQEWDAINEESNKMAVSKA